MRQYALPIAGVLLNLALNLSIAKDWTRRLPDWVVVILWVLSLVPLGYWLWTNERLHAFLRMRYVLSTIFIVLFGALCGGGIAGMGYAFWYRSQAQTTASQSSENKPPQSQETAKNSTQDKPEEKTEKKTDNQKKGQGKPKPKVEQHSQGDNSPNTNVNQQSSGPNSPNITTLGPNSPVTINPDRRFSDETANTTASKLASFKGTPVLISCTPGDAEQQQLARQLDFVLDKGAHWNSQLGAAGVIMARTIPGIEVQAPPRYRDAASALANQLTALGITAYVVNLEVGDSIYILIGTKR